MALTWFDAHLDLAYLAAAGRDMRVHLPALSMPLVAVTLPSLFDGGVRGVFGTLFVQKRIQGFGPEKDIDGPWCYSTPDEAYEACQRQLHIYHQWHQQGWIDLYGAPPRPAGATPAQQPPLNMIVLMEGAAGIRSLQDLREFYDLGVRVVSLSWVDGTRWAGGDQSGGDLSPDGHGLVRAMDAMGMIHDVSHLSEVAFWSVLRETQRPKIASHSNCRALLPGKQHPERHLSDAQIQALAQGGGVIGINLYSRFLVSSGRATIADVVRHIQHMSAVAGRCDCIGLGSDMDGGFFADQLPVDLTHPTHLSRLAEALSAAGYSDADIAGIAHGNWQRFLANALPGA